MKTLKSCILLFLMWCALFASACAFSQIHIKDNQSFHLAIGCIGLNVSDSYDDQWVNHFGIRLGKMHGIPAGVFGIEYGVDKKITENLFIGCRVYNDLIAKNTGNQSKFGWGIRLGFVL